MSHVSFEKIHFFNTNLFFYMIGQYVCSITRLFLAVGHYEHVYCERIGYTRPISKTKRLFYRTCFSCRSNVQLLFSTSAFLIPAH